MPKITVRLPNEIELISRPVMARIARDVMAITRVDSDAKVMILGTEEVIETNNSKLNQYDEPLFGGENNVVVSANDVTRFESVMSRFVRNHDEYPFFEDRRLGFSIRPVYVESDVTINFRYTCSSRLEALRYRNEFIARTAEDRFFLQHQIDYNVALPNSLLSLMAHIWELREQTHGYGESFPEWIHSIRMQPISLSGTLDGDINKSTVTVPVTQPGPTGIWDLNGPVQEEKDSGKTTYITEFSYRVQWRKCTHLYVDYPLVVHQSHIGSKFFNRKEKIGIEELPKKAGISVTAFDIMDGISNRRLPSIDGYRYPSYDDWAPNPYSVPKSCMSIMTWLLQVKPNKDNFILNLNAIPELRFTLETLELMKSNPDLLTRYGTYPIYIRIYGGQSALEDSKIYIDDDLKVYSTEPLDLRVPYHVRLYGATSCRKFDERGFVALQQNPEGAFQMFLSLEPNLDVEDGRRQLHYGNVMARGYIQWFYSYLSDNVIDTHYREIDVDSKLGGMVPWDVNNNIPLDPGSNEWKDWMGLTPEEREEKYPNLTEESVWKLSMKSRPKQVQYLAIVSKKR